MTDGTKDLIQWLREFDGPESTATNEAADVIEALEAGWDMLHWSCDNPDHKVAYLEMAKVILGGR